MNLSEDRISHLAHLVWESLRSQKMLRYPDPVKGLQSIKSAFEAYFRIGEEIDTVVRRKIASLKRGVAEMSREWEILYLKYFEEEARKRNF